MSAPALNPHPTHRAAGTASALTRTRRVLLGAGTATALVVAALSSPAAANTGSHPVVASGLNSPRHLSFAPNGDLYIAESGAPGADAGPCAEHPEFGTVCLTDTSSITRLDRKGVQTRVVTGLPTIVSSAGEATGATDVLLHGNTLSISMGLGGTPELRAQLGPKAALLGTVITVKQTGPRQQTTMLADLAAYEGAHDPDGMDVDSNPVDLDWNGRDLIAVDAAGNTVLGVGKKGGVNEFTVFDEMMFMDPPPFPGPPTGWPDPFPTQSVPTAAAQGPDGAWYVGELTGFPFQQGTSTIWRVGADGSRTAYATGLTTVTDLAWHQGSLYAVQISDTGILSGMMGSLVRIVDGGPQTVAGGLFAPYGVAFHQDSAYVTTGSVLPGGGAVIRVAL